MPRVAIVSTEGLPKKQDNLHYNAKGQIELGMRFAQAYLNLKKASEAAVTDPFAPGAIWSGKRTFNLPLQLSPEDLWLIITERDGMRFKGRAFFLRGEGRDDIYAVEGTATNREDGLVNFTTEKKGSFQVSFQGKLSTGELSLTYSGSGMLAGSSVSGTASLMP